MKEFGNWGHRVTDVFFLEEVFYNVGEEFYNSDILGGTETKNCKRIWYKKEVILCRYTAEWSRSDEQRKEYAAELKTRKHSWVDCKIGEDGKDRNGNRKQMKTYNSRTRARV